MKTTASPLQLRSARRILVLSGILFCSFAAGCKKESAPGPDVWAVVNGKDISRAEVDKYYRTRVNADAPAPSQEESLSLKLSILDELINNEILIERANKMNLVASDAEVEDKFTESKSPYTEEEFQKKLKDTNLTVDDLKSDIRRQLSVQKLLNREVVAKISITDQDVTDFYQKNRSQFNVAEPQFHIAQIVVTQSPGSFRAQPQERQSHNGGRSQTQDRRPRAETELGLRLWTVGDGLLGRFNRYHGRRSRLRSRIRAQQVRPGLEENGLGMKPGEVTPPIGVPNQGYRILKLLAKEPAGQRDLADPQVQQTIRDTLRNRKEQLLRSAYMIEARDDSHVTNYLARQIIESAGKLPASK